jgi:hypothetical protein
MLLNCNSVSGPIRADVSAGVRRCRQVGLEVESSIRSGGILVGFLAGISFCLRSSEIHRLGLWVWWDALSTVTSCSGIDAIDAIGAIRNIDRAPAGGKIKGSAASGMYVVGLTAYSTCYDCNSAGAFLSNDNNFKARAPSAALDPQGWLYQHQIDDLRTSASLLG